MVRQEGRDFLRQRRDAFVIGNRYAKLRSDELVRFSRGIDDVGAEKITVRYGGDFAILGDESGLIPTDLVHFIIADVFFL